MKTITKSICALALAIGLAGCVSDADVESYYTPKAADYFNINRRIVFYNGITGEYMFTIEGLCSLGNHDGAHTVTVTCKTGLDAYKKHFLSLSDNVTYFAEQIQESKVSSYYYKVVFKPLSIIPDIETK